MTIKVLSALVALSSVCPAVSFIGGRLELSQRTRPSAGRPTRRSAVVSPSLAVLTEVAPKLLQIPPTALGIAELCDLEASLAETNDKNRAGVAGGDGVGGADESGVTTALWLTRLAQRVSLERLLKADRAEYLATVDFLGPRLARAQLPNRQGLGSAPRAEAAAAGLDDDDDNELVPDCALANATLAPSPLDQALLWVFRKKVQEETGWASETKGLVGLLEEGRHFMLSPEGTPAAQSAMVQTTLGWLMTPALPPFYRLFMSGLVPSAGRGDPQWLVDAVQSLRAALPSEGNGALGQLHASLEPGNQLGPWFYAPALTSFVTPTFFGFLVGPSSVNRREDGALGGLVVEKCAFLQESSCKGLCLNMCKLPAQAFFQDTLGLPLTVAPNFATQECQWSFGEVPLDPSEDRAWPKGCLTGCPTRAEVRERKLELACE